MREDGEHMIKIGSAIKVVSLASIVVAGSAATGYATSAGRGRGSGSESTLSVPPTTIPPPTYDRRCEKLATSEAAMNSCVRTEVAQLMREQSRALSAEASVLGQRGVARAERKWVQFLDTECALEAQPYAGGSIQPLIVASCERRLTVERINEIRLVIATTPK